MNTIPNLKLNDGSLEGNVFLPIWNGYKNIQEDYSPIDYNKMQNGIFILSIGGEKFVESLIVTPEQVNAYNFLIAQSEQIHRSILLKLFSEYKSLQELYDYNIEDAKVFMPDIKNIEQFKDLIGLSQVHIMDVNKDEFAYVGYQFYCSWDDEHGLGFMTHKNRITEIGDAQTSFTNWVAKKDLEEIK